MSSDIAIKVANLSKCYQIYDKPRDRLKQFLLPKLQHALGMQPKRYFREFWALKEVSFEIKKGETVGIIGRNGCGKSTLLQMICGILNPTIGGLTTSGRIAALLELGTGFNPEFTGRENVYMNAAVLGLAKEEIDARFDAIISFADIGEFIEQPVKAYSSGMMIRLAFAVAISVDPDILIVDEALSVGDELFQRKCFSRIEEIRAGGATILFVSHSGSQIVELCDRAILLDAGEKLASGPPKMIVGRYQKLLYAPLRDQKEIREQIRLMDKIPLKPPASPDGVIPISQLLEENLQNQQEFFDPTLKPSSTVEYEGNGARIYSVFIETISGTRVNNLKRGKTYRYTYTVAFDRSAINVRFAMMIRTTAGVPLGGSTSAAMVKDSLPRVEAGTIYRAEFSFYCALNAGVYFLNAGVLGDLGEGETYLKRIMDIAVFRVHAEIGNLATGAVDFGCCPAITVVQS